MNKQINMDTDDLSKETYNGIIVTADKFHHDLTSEFGVLADDSETDDDFLNESETLIKEWLSEWDIEELIQEIFTYKQPSKKSFEIFLKQLLTNISEIRIIPINDRNFRW